MYPCSCLEGSIRVPPSKNYTTRFILCAAMAGGESVIRYAADNDDARAMVACCRQMGASIRRDGQELHVQGVSGNPSRPAGDLDVGNGGAVCRFLMAAAALTQGARLVTAFPQSLGMRPHDGLIGALEQLGLTVRSNGGRLPIDIEGGRPKGGRVTVSGEVSSQYLSSLLMLAPMLEQGMSIRVIPPLRSPAAVRITLDVMRRMGVEAASAEDLLAFEVPGGQRYRADEYTVPGDFPGAAAIAAACAMVPSSVRLYGLEPDCQAERVAFEFFGRMGLQVCFRAGLVEVKHDGRALSPITCEGDDVIDSVLSLAVAASHAEGPSHFNRLANLRLKECDRIACLAEELRKFGVVVTEGPDQMTVEGCSPLPYRPGTREVDSHQDHRLVMALSAMAIAEAEPTVIRHSQHVSKSYPAFFDDLATLGVRVHHDMG